MIVEFEKTNKQFGSSDREKHILKNISFNIVGSCKIRFCKNVDKFSEKL